MDQLQADAALIEEPTVPDPHHPLLQADAALIEEPASVIGGIDVKRRRAAGRNRVIEHDGKHCGCGCRKILEKFNYRSCYYCDDKDLPYNKLTLSCYGSGKRCTACINRD